MTGPSPDKDDSAVLEAQRVARREFPGVGLYRHYKGHDYALASPAVIEATLEPAVVYFGSRCRDVPWIRTLADWRSPVQFTDGIGTFCVVPRFGRSTPGPRAAEYEIAALEHQLRTLDVLMMYTMGELRRWREHRP